MSSENVQEQQKIFQDKQQYTNSYAHNFLIFSYIIQSYRDKWAVLVTEMHWDALRHISCPQVNAKIISVFTLR